VVVTIVLIFAVVWATGVVSLLLLILLGVLFGRDKAAAADRAVAAITAEIDLDRWSGEMGELTDDQRPLSDRP